MKGKAIAFAAAAAFAAFAGTGSNRAWDSALESLSERDPYALLGPRSYLPPSYYPRYFGAVFVPVHIMVHRAIAMVGEPPVRKTSDCRMPARPHA